MANVINLTDANAQSPVITYVYADYCYNQNCF